VVHPAIGSPPVPTHALHAAACCRCLFLYASLWRVLVATVPTCVHLFLEDGPEHGRDCDVFHNRT